VELMAGDVTSGTNFENGGVLSQVLGIPQTFVVACTGTNASSQVGFNPEKSVQAHTQSIRYNAI
jgi:hypothetical protein